MNSHFWDDGTPIERDRSATSNRAGKHRRAKQRDAALCKQAERILTLELMNLTGDGGGVYITHVTPAPDASRLAVHLSAPAEQLDSLRARLTAHTPALRRALAHGITRRKTPTLTFVLIPHDSLPNEETC